MAQGRRGVPLNDDRVGRPGVIVCWASGLLASDGAKGISAAEEVGGVTAEEVITLGELSNGSPLRGEPSSGVRGLSLSGVLVIGRCLC